MLNIFISRLAEDYSDNKRWIFFCEDETNINLPGLVQMLNKHDARKVRENSPLNSKILILVGLEVLFLVFRRELLIVKSF